MPAMLLTRYMAAFLRGSVLALAVGAVALPVSVQACAVMSQEDVARFKQVRDKWLGEETDLKVRGVFAGQPERPNAGSASEDYDESEVTVGMIIAADGSRYSIYVPVVIGCDFRNFSVENGAKGTFYLKRADEPMETGAEDRADGVIDNFDLIFFRPDVGM